MKNLSDIRKNVFNTNSKELDMYIKYFTEINKFARIKNKNILDIGCSTGKFLILCKVVGRAKNCWGIDPSAGRGSPINVLDIFKRNIQILKLENMNIIKGDILTYDFRYNQFHAIFILFSLHHIIRTEKNLLKSTGMRNQHINLFKKIYRLLDRPGILVICEIAGHNLKIFKKILHIRSNKSRGNVNYKTKHSPREYLTLLKESGFERVFTTYLPAISKLRMTLSNSIASFF